MTLLLANPAQNLEIEIPNGWDPRDYQLDAWEALEAGIKRLCLVWHRRAGKDSLSLNWAAASAVDTVGTYWHMAPTQRQVRKIVWDGIDKRGRRMIDQAFPKQLRESQNDTEMKLKLFNGSVWQCLGSDNYDSAVGANPLGVVFSEWSLANPAAWDYIRPILLENGGWAIFIYTPRGKNHGYSLLKLAKQTPGWYWQQLGVDQTGVVPLAEVEKERAELAMLHGPEGANSLVDQEWFVSFEAPVLGSYYGWLMAKADKEGRIGEVPHDPSLPVYTSWDLGMRDSTDIWFFQLHGRDVAIIDHLSHAGVSLSWYVNRMVGEVRFDEEGNKLPKPIKLDGEDEELHGHRRTYRYADSYVPHDALVSELGTQKRRIDRLYAMGVMARLVPFLTVADGINAVRELLPRCYFDETHTQRGRDGLTSYRKEWDDEKRIFRDKPLHDWASNPSDSFRYLAVGLRDAPPEPTVRLPPKPFTDEWHALMDKLESQEEAGASSSKKGFY